MKLSTLTGLTDKSKILDLCDLWVRIQKELISDLRRKNEGNQRKEIRAAVEINGKCNTKTRSEWSYSRRLKLQLSKQSLAVLMLS